MPYNKLPRLRDPMERDFVHEVKDLFLEHYKQEPDAFYQEDVKQVEAMSFLLQRCIISRRKNVKDSLAMLINMLKWRKESRLRELTDQDFPIEYFTCGAAFLYEPDKFGNRTLYIRTQHLRSVAELKASLKEYLAYLIYKIDDSVHGHSWSVIFDLTNTGWNNYDVDLMMHFLTLLKDYFPVNVDYVLAINFPWILSTAWAIAKRLIPPERRDVVIFASEKEIFNFIDKENVPDFLGGTCQREYKLYHKGCESVIEYLLLQDNPPLTAKRIKDIIKTFGEVLDKDQVKTLTKRLELSGRK